MSPMAILSSRLLTEMILPMKMWQVIGIVETDGWKLVRTRGSHRQYKHSEKPGTVTIAGKRSDDLHPKTAASILGQAGLRR